MHYWSLEAGPWGSWCGGRGPYLDPKGGFDAALTFEALGIPSKRFLKFSTSGCLSGPWGLLMWRMRALYKRWRGRGDAFQRRAPISTSEGLSLFIYLFVYSFVHLFMYWFIDLFIYVCMHLCIDIYIYIYTCICTYISIMDLFKKVCEAF